MFASLFGDGVEVEGRFCLLGDGSESDMERRELNAAMQVNVPVFPVSEIFFNGLVNNLLTLLGGWL